MIVKILHTNRIYLTRTSQLDQASQVILTVADKHCEYPKLIGPYILFSLIKYHLDGSCEYDGSLLERVVLPSAEKCQSNCKGDPKCKVWIYNVPNKLCVMKKSFARKCDAFVGPPSPKREECFPGTKIFCFSRVLK